MANFAQLDENNVVIQVIVVNNNELLLDGKENETKGIIFCKSLYGEHTRWRQTSYNQSFRFNYAGIGSTYDEQRDAFIPIQPFPSWILNEATCTWEAPVPMPVDNKEYRWDEQTQTWQPITP